MIAADAEAVACPTCLQPANQPCATTSGYRAASTHLGRVAALDYLDDSPRQCARRRADAEADWSRLKKKRKEVA